MSHKKEKPHTPFIGEHSAFGGFEDLPPGAEKTLFEDLTTNHNKTMVLFFVSEGPATIIISTRDGKKIERTVVRNNNSITIQVENIKKVTVRCDSILGTCSGQVTVEETFCIFC
jgi:hypothetical protein